MVKNRIELVLFDSVQWCHFDWKCWYSRLSSWWLSKWKEKKIHWNCITTIARQRIQWEAATVFGITNGVVSLSITTRYRTKASVWIKKTPVLSRRIESPFDSISWKIDKLFVFMWNAKSHYALKIGELYENTLRIQKLATENIHRFTVDCCS